MPLCWSGAVERHLAVQERKVRQGVVCMRGVALDIGVRRVLSVVPRRERVGPGAATNAWQWHAGLRQKSLQYIGAANRVSALHRLHASMRSAHMST
jgi:hypothetical protein